MLNIRYSIIWFKTISVCIYLYILFDYAFMTITFQKIPIGELLLLLTLPFINYKVIFNKLRTTIQINLYFLFLIYFFSRIIMGFMEYGIWALRDGTNVIESLFILLGFFIIKDMYRLSWFYKYLRITLLLTSLISLSFPIRNYIYLFSPFIYTPAGAKLPLFFTYVNSFMLMLLTSALILFEGNSLKGFNFIISFFFIIFALFFSQFRTVYLQFIAVLFFLYYYKKQSFFSIIEILLLCIFILVIFELSNIELKGRYGGNISFDFMLNHFLSIFGYSSSDTAGAAGGVSQRLQWWTFIYKNLTNKWSSFVFGIGYGMPLTDFVVQGRIVREPHNSLISIFARSGIIGTILFLSFHYELFRNSIKAIRETKIDNWLKNFFLIILLYFILVWIYSIGEDAFEKPFNSIPYYFFGGIVLRYRYLKTIYNQSPNRYPS